MTRFRFTGLVVLIGALLTLAACGDGEPTDTLVRTVSTATVAPAVSPTATAVRGGLVCLNSAARFDKWNRAAVR